MARRPGADRVAAAVPASGWIAASRDEVLTPGGPSFVPAPYAKVLADAIG